ncbi:transaldolase [Curtobacterium sp. Leaf261]|uniref:transaldolase n=1 Tax=Curtobacterium sp. Leaf261 TaxID=1736311 RepID=UPI0006F81988|nr:transaldolase [Curtobacterium sp. Leaf261]KQO64791.1 transaldolase [Curtobacterium sp. Leaf261]
MSDTTTPTAALSAAGVSIWLDDLSRELLETGRLDGLIADRNVVGVTTNPTIFASALANGERYNDQVRELGAAGTPVTDAIFEITTQDVANASDKFKDIYDATNGFDGRVSIEVEPGLAHETAKTIEQAKFLHGKVGRENVLIKIPATLEGLEAITEVIGAGISVNVTLIFSLERYRAVIDAYLGGLEKAKAAGHDLSKIHSVASFFVSRVDSEIDKRLDAVGTDEAKALKSKAGVANAQLAYQVYEQAFASERAKGLEAAGANPQRPLWASTGVKDPSLPDTLYVTGLVAAGVVNTMPGKTLEATFDHGVVEGDTITGEYDAANQVMDQLAAVGIDYDDVVALLEKEGVDKFNVSWGELVDTVKNALEGGDAAK